MCASVPHIPLIPTYTPVITGRSISLPTNLTACPICSMSARSNVIVAGSLSVCLIGYSATSSFMSLKKMLFSNIFLLYRPSGKSMSHSIVVSKFVYIARLLTTAIFCKIDKTLSVLIAFNCLFIIY